MNTKTTHLKAWLVSLSAALFFLYEFIQMHIFNAISDAIKIAFNINATELGFLSSTYLWGNVILSIPAGMLLDRFSTRTIILTALSGCIIGTIGFAMSHSFVMAAFFHCLSGCGNAFCFLSCMILIARWFHLDRQAFVVGIVVTMAFLGGLISQTPFTYLVEWAGWRMALVFDGGLGCFFFLLIFLNVEDSSENSHKTNNVENIFNLYALKTALKNIQNTLAGFYTCLLNLPIMLLDAVWGISYLKTVYGLGSIQSANVASMIFLGSIVSCPFVGFISDKWQSRRNIMMLGALFSFISVSLIVFINQWSYPSLLILFFIIGFCTSTQILSYPVVIEGNAKVLTGTAMGLVSTIIISGAAIAQIVFGKLLDLGWEGLATNGQRIYSINAYNQAMLIFPAAIGIGLLLSFFIREKREHVKLL